MEIHKPKAAHSWREFLIEIGTIICGILIALGLEQGAEWLHWRHQVQEAQDAMRLELQTDDGPQAVVRAAIDKCLIQQLDDIQTAIEAGADRVQIQKLARAYAPPRRTWDSDAWRVASSSQVAAHMPPDVMLAWSGPYRLVPQLADSNVRERHDLATLRAGRRSAGQPSEIEAERWLAAIQNLREDNDSMSYGSLGFLVAATRAGAAVPDAIQQSVLREVRSRYGPCVTTPDLSSIHFDSQLNQPGRD